MKMMQKQVQFNRSAGSAYSVAWFEALFNALDDLHTDVCTGRFEVCSPLALDDAAGWLDDIIYTAQEAVSELRARAPRLPVTTTGRHHNGSGGSYETPNA